jgi:hypothetical protein
MLPGSRQRLLPDDGRVGRVSKRNGRPGGNDRLFRHALHDGLSETMLCRRLRKLLR